MKRLLVALAFFTFAAPARAQVRQARNWTLFVATGWMGVSGAGSGTLMGERIPGLYGLRFRIEDGPWWLGVEMDAWTARATPAGRDSIVARSNRFGSTSTGKATFYSTTLNFLARRDVWHGGPADAYLIGSLGGTMAGGRIVGKCTSSGGYPVCSEPPYDSRSPGMAVALGAGAGVTVSYADLIRPIPSWARWVLGQRVMVEGRAITQSATEGRFTGGVLHLGIGW